MKTLITSRADANIKNLTDLTFPSIKSYAQKVGADFMVLDHATDCTHMEGKWHYRILKHYDLFNDYDRILHLDSDVLVSPSCPNIFEEVPYDKIGSVFEDKGSRSPSRRSCIHQVQYLFGDVGWREGYINTGCFLTSKIHKDIFQKIEGMYYEDWGHDDVHLGFQINKNKFQIHELSFKWNHMTMFSEEWNNDADRFNSHIIHYAGKGIFDRGKFTNKLGQIESDALRLK